MRDLEQSEPSGAKYLQLHEAPICLDAHPSQPLLLTACSTSGATVSDVKPIFSRQSPRKAAPRYKVEHSAAAASFFDASRFHLACTDASILTFDINKREPIATVTLSKAEQSDDCVATTFRTVNENSFLVGDDTGGLHLYDVRTSSAASQQALASCLEQADYVSAIEPVSAFEKDAFLVTSGDGTLCAYDLRFPPKPAVRLQYAFDSFQEDVLSLAILPKHNLAVAGTLTGPLNIYDLRFMDDSYDPDSAAHVDRFYGHPEAVNVVMAWEEEEDIVLSASSDGIVRIIDIPNRKLVGVLEYAVHEEERRGTNDSLQDLRKRREGKKKRKEARWPVEHMVRVRGLGMPVLALLGHSAGIQFCEAGALVDGDSCDLKSGNATAEAGAQASRDGQGGDSDDQAEKTRSSRRKKRRRKRFEHEEKRTHDSGFFEGL
ncbi:WD repeat-containing protein JIP5 [Gracilariopsis chorda]|uniref:WD repeat-containing protein JIP5 n=1 Tax=Gracilariopsis chorda TaxID=448386 RepID=A0A2V3IX05_9FLOR|nr:WD repeat-containing protein JIP5 [Gracilariopsis chorda]|eukprot:PXF46686.1 WD repeat-containing protein JIP5 [Gracilariopsis chorda]